MMCYKPREQYPPYHSLDEAIVLQRFFTNSLRDIQAKPNPDSYEVYYLLRWAWKAFGYSEDSIDKIIKKPKAERRIMKEEIDALIEMTITQIKTAIESKKPGEAKVYTEMLVLLRSTLNIQSPGSNRLFRTTSGDVGQTYEKPFEKISDKHIPDV